MTLGQGQTRNVAQYPLQHMTNAPAMFEVVMFNGFGGKAFTRNIWFDLDLRSRSHDVEGNASCDLDLRSRSNQIFLVNAFSPKPLNITTMYLQSLKLLQPML